MKAKSTRKILVVDDEDSVAQALELTLRDLGYDVAVASCGTEAIQKAVEINPDLVLMDIRLKEDINGIGAANEIRSRFDIPVVYITSYADEDILSQVRVTEPFGYLLKPFEKRELYITVEIALYRHSTEKALKESLAQLSKKNRYETIVRTVIQSVHQSINLQDVLENAVDAMSKNIDGVGNVSIYMVEGEEAVLKAYRGYSDWFIQRVGRIPYQRGFTWKTIIDGKPRYCPDVDQDTFIGPAGREIGTKSYAAMPIRFQGKTIGTININSLKNDAFSQEELRLLEIVAHQIGIAISNAKQAEEMRKAKEELELRVEERTRELGRINKELEKEIGWHRQAEKALRESELRYRLVARATQDAIWDWDLITDKLWWNEGIQKIFGYSVDETGAYINWWYERIHPEDRERVASGLYSSIERGEEFWSDEYRYLCADGSYAHVFDRGYLMHDDRGKPVRMVGAISDLTERKQAEEQIKKSLREKEVLLKEIHHRVKNNLQIVSSLLNLQSRNTTGKARERFRESQNRVKSMALIHEKLYQSEDLYGINFKEYIEGLLSHLLGSYGVRSSIKLNLSIDDVSMNIDKAVPCGLIVNELVSNALKYAFLGKKLGEVRVALKLDKGNYSMIIGNNGDPFPGDVNFRNTKSLGLQLVCALTDQLKGTVELDRGSGTEFKITFPAS